MAAKYNDNWWGTWEHKVDEVYAALPEEAQDKIAEKMDAREVLPPVEGLLSRLSWIFTDVLRGIEVVGVTIGKDSMGPFSGVFDITVAELGAYCEVIARLHNEGFKDCMSVLGSDPMLVGDEGTLSATQCVQCGELIGTVSLWSGYSVVREF